MPVINRGDDYFAVVTYTGNGTSQTISGLRFQPDFVWIKGRSGATDHALYDAQRGVQSRLESNTTDAQVTSDNGVTAFNSDGFSIGSLAQVNTNGATYVAWCWKEGATQGFDIVTFTIPASGTFSYAHNLGVPPAMVIFKPRNVSSNWNVWHKSMGANDYILLNSTAAKGTDANRFAGAPTSTQVNCGTSFNGGGSTQDGWSLVFAEVAGFSKFGTYTGNGSADGPFVFCGFRPRFVVVKCSSNSTAATTWVIHDAARNTYNAVVAGLDANGAGAEWTDASGFDFLSNGFKPRRNSEYANFSGWTYIYAAFAENPFKNALAR